MTYDKLIEKGYEIVNYNMKSIEVRITPHFNYAITLDIHLENGYTGCSLGGFSVEDRVGYMIKEFVLKIIGGINNDGVNLSTLKDIPVRAVFDGRKVIGLGHYLKDNFIIYKDLVRKYEGERK